MPLERYPYDILLYILPHLFLEDIASLTATSKHYYALLDSCLYREDAKPSNRYAIYWAAVNASVVVARKALAAGTPANDSSDVTIRPWRMSRVVASAPCRHWFNDEANRMDAPFSFQLQAPAPCVNAADVTATALCLLRAGASLPALRDASSSPEIAKERVKEFRKFMRTPLAHTVAIFKKAYYEILWEHHDEIAAENGHCSGLSLLKLAVATADAGYAEKTLKEHGTEILQTKEASLCLWELARKTTNDTMIDWVYNAIQKHTPFAKGLALPPRPRPTLMEHIYDMLEDGAPTDNMQDVRWQHLSTFDNRLQYEVMLWREELNLGAYANPLEYGLTMDELAQRLEHSALLDLAFQDHPEIAYDTPEAWEIQLESACRWGDADWVRIILERGFDIREEESDSERPSRFLHLAMKPLDPVIIQTLLAHGARAAGRAKGRSLVAQAIMAGYEEKRTNLVAVLRLLLEAGADTESVVDDMAAGYKMPEQMTRRHSLLYYRMLGQTGQTSFKQKERVQYQDALCQPGCLELLQDHGIAVYRRDSYFINGAITQSNVPLLQRLLEDGFLNDTTLCSKSGMLYRYGEDGTKHGLLEENLFHSTLIHLSNEEHPDAAISMIGLLLKHGADIRNNPDTIVRCAIQYYRLFPERTMRVIRLLLDAGAAINGPGNGRIVGIPAVKGTNLELQRLLLEHGASVIGRDGGETQTAAERICTFSAHGDRKVLDLFFDHDEAALTADPAHLQSLAEAACRSRNVPMLRTLLMRRPTSIAPRDVLGWALSIDHTARGAIVQGIDDRTLAFAMAIGGPHDAVTAGRRSNIRVSLGAIIARDDEDLVMTALHWYQYCMEGQTIGGVALEHARQKKMARVLDYLEQNPGCTSPHCEQWHMQAMYYG